MVNKWILVALFAVVAALIIFRYDLQPVQVGGYKTQSRIDRWTGKTLILSHDITTGIVVWVELTEMPDVLTDAQMSALKGQ